MVKNPLPMQEMRIRSLGGEDPLKKEMATHSSFLAWKTPWTGEPRGLQSMGSQKSTDTTEQQNCPYCMQLTLGLPVSSSTRAFFLPYVLSSILDNPL